MQVYLEGLECATGGGGYTRLDVKYCGLTSDVLGEYSSQSEAIQNCDQSAACTGYQDGGCDGAGTFKTCSNAVSDYGTSSSGTCMYVKP